MKTIIVSLLTLFASVAVANERGAEAYSNSVIEAQLEQANFEACVAGDNSRCNCAVIQSKARRATKIIAAVDSAALEAPVDCLRNARAITLGADGPATANMFRAERARSEQYCRDNADQLVAVAAGKTAEQRAELSDELTLLAQLAKVANCK